MRGGDFLANLWREKNSEFHLVSPGRGKFDCSLIGSNFDFSHQNTDEVVFRWLKLIHGWNTWKQFFCIPKNSPAWLTDLLLHQ